MRQLLSCETNLFVHLKTVFLDSGRGIQHRGHYQDCIQNLHMKYAVIEFGSNGKDANLNMALCLPKECTDQLVKTTAANLLTKMKLPFNVYQIYSQGENYNFELTWVSYLTILLLLTVAVLCFAATIRYFSSNKKDKKNKWLQCFDVKTNIKQHFQVRKNEPLNVWDGVRALAMMWVVIGHFFGFMTIGVINVFNLLKVASKPFYLIIEAGLFSVDIFFALGGFFLAFVLLRNKITFKVCGMAILQRVLRIWPAYILAMMIFYSLLPKMGSGPLWPQIQQTTAVCNTMWKDIFFISNFTNTLDKQCLNWGWYLQVDFQLFLCGVFLLFLSTKNKTLSNAVNLICCLLSSIYVFIFTYKKQNHIYADVAHISDQSMDDFMQYVYTQPYGRCLPYFMGLYFGILFMQYRGQKNSKQNGRQSILATIKDKVQQNRWLRIGMEWTGVGLMAFVTFIPRTIQEGVEWPQALHSLYWTLSKPIFIFGMFMTVLPSILGFKHSFFNLILNAKIFVIIARISFCTYLLHNMLLMGFLRDRTYDRYMLTIDIMVMYLGLLILCLVVGFILTVTVEVPFGRIVKLMFQGVALKYKQQSKRQVMSSMLTQESIGPADAQRIEERLLEVKTSSGVMVRCVTQKQKGKRMC